jgi:hypothetical protein
VLAGIDPLVFTLNVLAIILSFHNYHCC